MLSSVLKSRGHEADCFVTSEEKDFHQAVLDYQPDVLGIYATTGQEKWCYDNITRWRKELPHLKTVMGGPHPSFDPEVLHDEEYVDAILKLEMLGWQYRGLTVLLIVGQLHAFAWLRGIRERVRGPLWALTASFALVLGLIHT